MLNSIYRLAVPLAWACVGIIFVPFTASAQTAERDPLTSPMSGPAKSYQSAFSEYKRYQDPELMPWRAANDLVREFGSMAQMEGMGGSKATEGAGGAGDPQDKAGQGNRPVEPAHDMGEMSEKSLPASPKNPVPSGGKPSEMDAMPGHDMRKMKDATHPTKIKAAPARDMKDKGGMADMPGHDMGSMQPKAAPSATTKSPSSNGKPAVPAPMTMPDHGGMSK